MSQAFDRRGFLKTAAATGIGLSFGRREGGRELGAHESTVPAGLGPAPGPSLFRAPPLETVRVGVVGVGHRGPTHVRNLLNLEGAEVVAICDVIPEKVERMQQRVTEAGHPTPAGYTRGPYDFRRMCGEEDLDLVVTATPWEWHTRVCMAAMENGKHAATEVPMGISVDECWQLVETAERTRRHCVMLENCCYDRTEMMILNMVRRGLLGELLHAECGYLHDLRALKLTDFYEGRWRVRYSLLRNGDLYPTHGLGPVAQWLDINRGNQFEYMVSFASKARGLKRWAAERIGQDSPEALRDYEHGDVVSTLIRTVRGETILLTHDTDSPRPYSRRIVLQGTTGLIRKYPEEKIHVEGRSPDHEWEETASYQAEFEHPIWKTLEQESRGGGHGGMDYIEAFRLIQCLLAGTPTDMDVYDGAAWSAIFESSGRSIESRSRPVDLPDFTRGAWKERPPLGIVTV